MQVTILEAKNRLSELMKCAQAGEEVIIASRGEPVMKLVSIDSRAAKTTEPKDGASLLAWLQARPSRAPMRTDDDIDAYVRETRQAWD